MEYETLAEIIEAVHEFYGQGLSSFGFSVWEHAFKDFELPVIAQAFQSYMTGVEGRFCPKPADIIEILRGSSSDNAMIAWATVINAVKAHGVGKSVAFDDRIIMLVIADLGGWTELCKAQEKELSFLEKRFIDRYKMYSRMPALPQCQPRLIGHVEASNNMHGYQDSELNQVVMIGDESKCREILTLPELGKSAQSVGKIVSLLQFKEKQENILDNEKDEPSVQNRRISDE